MIVMLYLGSKNHPRSHYAAVCASMAAEALASSRQGAAPVAFAIVRTERGGRKAADVEVKVLLNRRLRMFVATLLTAATVIHALVNTAAAASEVEKPFVRHCSRAIDGSRRDGNRKALWPGHHVAARHYNHQLCNSSMTCCTSTTSSRIRKIDEESHLLHIVHIIVHRRGLVCAERCRICVAPLVSDVAGLDCGWAVVVVVVVFESVDGQVEVVDELECCNTAGRRVRPHERSLHKHTRNRRIYRFDFQTIPNAIVCSEPLLIIINVQGAPPLLRRPPGPSHGVGEVKACVELHPAKALLKIRNSVGFPRYASFESVSDPRVKRFGAVDDYSFQQSCRRVRDFVYIRRLSERVETRPEVLPYQRRPPRCDWSRHRGALHFLIAVACETVRVSI
mmetsp:Transcript_23758/g.42100  ORF Transcript_23758/g.42100 Transcript_23758/m.42100 type:complete len:393 (-) Transcript_23758:239-1417(-)